VDNFSIRERLARLKNEIEQLQKEDRVHVKNGRRSSLDIAEHNARLIRMRRIMDEIAELIKNKPRTRA